MNTYLTVHHATYHGSVEYACSVNDQMAYISQNQISLLNHPYTEPFDAQSPTAPYGFSYKQGSHASWKFLDFFLENSRTWKVLEKHFWSWKVLEIEA